ncbi:lysozyme inhibitor LprI family protein [Burkholderia sp. Bp8998]|uniref:lysozyme inhibitor LprI family protein n=1 Tax=Burkholderia sp. Bp8998 TaxID=2184557 RepID=UPI0021AB76DA|nr:hypothetical protein [Burkholderia sp. Bp8998]
MSSDASGGEPNIDGDIECLARIDALNNEIKEYGDLFSLTSSAWTGLKTDLDVVRALLSFQTALERARVRANWDDVGLDPVSQGQCGDAAQDDLQRMRELRKIEQVIASLAHLETEMGHVWAGYKTDVVVAKAYVPFQGSLSAARAESHWADDGYTVIESGRAGATAAADIRNMRELVSLHARIQEFADLSGKTSSLWSGLQTKIDGIEPALKFFEQFSAALANLANTPELLAAVKAPVALLLGDSNVLLEPSGIKSVAWKDLPLDSTPLPEWVHLTETEAASVTAALAPVQSTLRPSFDCSKAHSDAEHLICTDAQLAAADVELAAIYAKAKAAVTDQVAFKARTLEQWNYREKTCHDRECLARWYADQSTVLQHIAESGNVAAE